MAGHEGGEEGRGREWKGNGTEHGEPECRMGEKCDSWNFSTFVLGLGRE